MAVPFCVPNKSKIENFTGTGAGGGTTSTANQNHSPPASSSSSSSSAAAASNLPTAAQRIIAWQMLAYAMCHALREYYVQTASTKDGFIRGGSGGGGGGRSTLQAFFSDKTKTIWK